MAVHAHRFEYSLYPASGHHAARRVAGGIAGLSGDGATRARVELLGIQRGAGTPLSRLEAMVRAALLRTRRDRAGVAEPHPYGEGAGPADWQRSEVRAGRAHGVSADLVPLPGHGFRQTR